MAAATAPGARGRKVPRGACGHELPESSFSGAQLVAEEGEAALQGVRRGRVALDTRALDDNVAGVVARRPGGVAGRPARAVDVGGRRGVSAVQRGDAA